MWPIEYIIPEDVIEGISAFMDASSGAAVILRIRGGERVPFWSSAGCRFSEPYIDSRSVKEFAETRTSRGWMPFLVGFMKGPSQWAPRDSAPSEASL